MGHHKSSLSRTRKRNKMSKNKSMWHKRRRLLGVNHDHSYTMDSKTANKEEMFNTLTQVNPLASENISNNEQLINVHRLDRQLPSTSKTQDFPLRDITDISKSQMSFEQQYHGAKRDPTCSYMNMEKAEAETEESNLEFSFISEEEYSRVAQHELEIEVDTSKPKRVLSGNRIVDLQYVLEWSLKLQLIHSKVCTNGQLCVVDERNGLAALSLKGP